MDRRAQKEVYRVSTGTLRTDKQVRKMLVVEYRKYNSETGEDVATRYVDGDSFNVEDVAGMFLVRDSEGATVAGFGIDTVVAFWAEEGE